MMTAIAGATPDGAGHWHAEVGQLSGGDPAVAEAFNKASDVSARSRSTRRAPTPPRGPGTLT
jgi:hypothetical protein